MASHYFQTPPPPDHESDSGHYLKQPECTNDAATKTEAKKARARAKVVCGRVAVRLVKLPPRATELGYDCFK